MLAIAGAGPHVSTNIRASPLTATPVAIGVVLPLAGDDGADGIMARNGVQLAIAQWNAEGKQPPIAAIYRDSAAHVQNPHADEGSDSDPRAGHRIVQLLANTTPVVAIIGALTGAAASEEAPAAGRERIALVSGSAPRNVASASGASDTFFRTGAGDRGEGIVAAEVAWSKGYRQVFTLLVTARDKLNRNNLETARASAVLRAFVDTLRTLGGTTLLADSTAARAEAMLIIGPSGRGTFLAVPPASHVLAQDARTGRMALRGYAPPPMDYARIAPAAKLLPELANVQRRFRDRFGTVPSKEAVDYIVATRVVLNAIGAASTGSRPNRADVLAKLQQVRSRTRSECFTIRWIADRKRRGEQRCIAVPSD